MRVKQKKSTKVPNMIRFVLSAVFFLLVLGAFFKGAERLSQKAGREGDLTLKNAIIRATVQCYAIEGRYPPSVDYLESHYGIRIDKGRYHVFYEGFASNIMPDITVVLADRREAGGHEAKHR